MYLLKAFELEIRFGTPNTPVSVAIALTRYSQREDGRLFIAPPCSSFEDIEGQINSLQDELDELRARARRAFRMA
jgi:hypothetical protein